MIFHACLPVKIKLDFSHSSQTALCQDRSPAPAPTPKLQDVFSILKELMREFLYIEIYVDNSLRTMYIVQRKTERLICRLLCSLYNECDNLVIIGIKAKISKDVQQPWRIQCNAGGGGEGMIIWIM